MNRSVPLTRNPGKPLRARTGLSRAKRIKPVSARRQQENRQRRAMIKALYPEPARCARPGCPRTANDVHETLSRARSGGVITDPSIWAALCRPCHDEVTFRPESELGWAYEAQILVHSWGAAS